MKRLVAALALAVMSSWTCPAWATPAKLIVAVLYFDNNSPDRKYDVLQKGLADMMVTDLSSIDGVQVVEREKLQKLVDELKLQKTKFFDPKNAQKLGSGIGANFAVTGAMTAIDPEIRLDIRLIEIKSGKIVLADKMVGSKDRFFELQEQLIAKFQTGLNLQRSGGVSPANRVKNVAMLLDYSKGVDSADRGDLQGASAQLSKVVRSAPEFQLAKLRLDEITKRLDAAGKKRQEIISTLSDDLMQHADAFLRDKDLSALSSDEAGRYFGYRALRSDDILLAIHKRLSPKAIIRSMYGETTIPSESLDEVTGLMRAYVENATTMIAELKSYREGKGEEAISRLSFQIDKEDKAQVEQIGVVPLSSQRSIAAAEVDLARYLLLGKLRFSPAPALPSLAQMNAGNIAKALALIDGALKEIDEHTPRDKEHEVIDAHEAAGDGLIAMGRFNDGVARWQLILDQYPTSPEFARIEKKIRDEVEAEKADVEDAAVFTNGPCDSGVVITVVQALPRVMRKHGLSGAKASVASLERHCGGDADAMTYQGIYMNLAGTATMIGECDFVQELKARSAKLGSTYLSSFDAFLKQCRH